MKLAVFDIDGTLTCTNGIDGRCYNQAFVEAGIEDLDPEWSRYEHRTDSGIALQIFRQHLGRPPRDGELAAVQERFFELLREAREAEPDEFREVPGAHDFVGALLESGWAVVLATGAWEVSARIKLEAAGFDPELPLMPSDERIAREVLVRDAIALAVQQYEAGPDGFERTVSVGDGEWDAAVARALGLPFVGVTIEGDEAALRAAGTSHLLSDYSSTESALSALEEARVPKG